jgi:hypothetical protein
MCETQKQRSVTRGLVSELAVASYLLSYGFEVYFGFGNTQCDLVAIRGDVIRRVEVKTAAVHVTMEVYNQGGSYLHVSLDHPEWCDWLLCVTPDGCVVTDPRAVRGTSFVRQRLLAAYEELSWLTGET